MRNRKSDTTPWISAILIAALFFFLLGVVAVEDDISQKSRIQAHK